MTEICHLEFKPKRNTAAEKISSNNLQCGLLFIQVDSFYFTEYIFNFTYTMQFINKKILDKALFLALAVCTSCTYAAKSDRSFEDGLSNSWTQPASHHALRGDEMDEHRSGLSHRYEHEWEFHVSPVPEPESDALMFAGLAVIFIAVRRKTSSATVDKALKA